MKTEKTKQCILDEIVAFDSLPTPRILPVFRGYTVDMRLREFRKIELDEFPEFIPFESPKGRDLIAGIFREKFGEIYNPARTMEVSRLLARFF